MKGGTTSSKGVGRNGHAWSSILPRVDVHLVPFLQENSLDGRCEMQICTVSGSFRFVYPLWGRSAVAVITQMLVTMYSHVC